MPTTLRVGLDHAPPIPMQSGSPASDGSLGSLRGFEIDLLQILANAIGAQLHFRRAQWSTIIHELRTGDLDLVCSACTVTPERARTVAFCTPHLHLSLAVVKRTPLSNSPPGLDLAHERIGVRAGTTAEDYLKAQRLIPDLISESNDQLYRALGADRLSAVIDDSPIAAHFARSSPGLAFVGNLPNTQASYAIMVRKDDPALETRINLSLAALASDGTLASLQQTWFPPSI